MANKLHPVAEAALRAIGKAGKKALERAAIEGVTTAADSLLDDVERGAGGISSRVRDVRTRIQDRKEETMAGKKKGRRAAEEEDEDLEEEEDEEDAGEEDDEATSLIFDAEVMIRNALYILEAAAETDKDVKKVMRKAEELHDDLTALLEADGDEDEDDD